MMVVSNKNAGCFENMSLWECGYTLCIDVCKLVEDSHKNDDVLTQRLKSVATVVPLELSKSSSYKIGKQHIKFLRSAFVNSKQLSTMLMLCHDMNYVQTQDFLMLNSKINILSSKLWKYIKFCERKVRCR